MTTDLMAAQCFLFFAAGFEGSTSTLQFLLYELALHPDIQLKARNEIREELQNAESDGAVTYESLKKMPYLDMLIDGECQRCPGNLSMRRRIWDNFRHCCRNPSQVSTLTGVVSKVYTRL